MCFRPLSTCGSNLDFAIHRLFGRSRPECARMILSMTFDFGQDWVEKLYKLRNISTLVGTGLGLAFAVVAIIIIGSTIRIMVLARAKEIAIMRLVGATNGFIRLPFVLEGCIQGVMGGLLALALTWGTNAAISHAFIRTGVFQSWSCGTRGTR